MILPVDRWYLEEVVGRVYEALWLVTQPREVVQAVHSAPRVGLLPHRHQNNLAQDRWWQQGSHPSFVNVSILDYCCVVSPFLLRYQTATSSHPLHPLPNFSCSFFLLAFVGVNCMRVYRFLNLAVLSLASTRSVFRAFGDKRSLVVGRGCQAQPYCAHPWSKLAKTRLDGLLVMMMRAAAAGP